MLHEIARSLKPIVPGWLYRSLEMNRGRKHSVKWLKSVGVLELAQTVADKFDYRVQGGPFAGMRYTRSALLTRHATPALLGTYERQLYPFLTMAAERCDLVVDLGSAEGYFAVGMAYLGKQVVTFDADPNEREVCREMAIANNVSDRVTIRPWCDPKDLIELVQGRDRVLIISDIDGGELALFTPEVVAGIRHCDLIIEMHDDTSGNAAFVKRFDGRLVVLDHPPAPDPAAVEKIQFLGGDAKRMATEYRPFQQWLLRERTSSARG